MNNTSMHDVVARPVLSLGDTAIQRAQEIPDEFLRELQDFRTDSKLPAGNMHRVAAIPVALVELWAAQGFDVYRESAKAILKRLRDADLDAFITTNKRV